MKSAFDFQWDSSYELSDRSADGNREFQFSLRYFGSHVFNPEWHPHGRFHAAQLVGFCVAMSIMELWVVWRHSLASRTVRVAVTAFPVLFWGGEFFALFVAGTSPSPHPATPNTFQLGGVAVYGNLFFSGVLITLSVVAYLLISHGGQNTNHTQRSQGVSSLLSLSPEDEEQ